MACITTVGDWVISPYSNVKIAQLTTNDPNEVVTILMADPSKPDGVTYTYDGNCRVLCSDLSISKIIIDRMYKICLVDEDNDAVGYCTDGVIEYPIILEFPVGTFNNTETTKYITFSDEDSLVQYVNSFGVTVEKLDDECCFGTFDINVNIDIEVSFFEPYSIPLAGDTDVLTGFIPITVDNGLVNISNGDKIPLASPECARMEFWNITSGLKIAEIEGSTTMPVAMWTNIVGTFTQYMTIGQTMDSFDFDKASWARDTSNIGVNATDLEIKTFVGGTCSNVANPTVLSESTNVDNDSILGCILTAGNDNQAFTVTVGNPSGTSGANVEFASYSVPYISPTNPNGDILGNMTDCTDWGVKAFTLSGITYYSADHNSNIDIYLERIVFDDASFINGSVLLNNTASPTWNYPNILKPALQTFFDNYYPNKLKLAIQNQQNFIITDGQVESWCMIYEQYTGGVAPKYITELHFKLVKKDTSEIGNALITNLLQDYYTY